MDIGLNSKNHDTDKEEQKFGNVATLDWLQTWRKIQINQAPSPDPGK